MSLSPGFADPVAGAQDCFRAILDAMSRPGRVRRAGAGLIPPAPLDSATAAVLLTLADADTPVWHDAGATAEAWLRFHAGCPIVPDPRDARFVLACGAPPRLGALDAGTDEGPEGSATLIMQVQTLREGQGWRLRGPGIAAEHRLQVAGAPAWFGAEWEAQRRGFPRGVDVILCAGDRLAALPRGIALQEG
jgi:alpha-D-ribose 1-methylphosphonate 5-triphosphate synthase subunit PhnH